MFKLLLISLTICTDWPGLKGIIGWTAVLVDKFKWWIKMHQSWKSGGNNYHVFLLNPILWNLKTDQCWFICGHLGHPFSSAVYVFYKYPTIELIFRPLASWTNLHFVGYYFSQIGKCLIIVQTAHNTDKIIENEKIKCTLLFSTFYVGENNRPYLFQFCSFCPRYGTCDVYTAFFFSVVLQSENNKITITKF